MCRFNSTGGGGVATRILDRLVLVGKMEIVHNVVKVMYHRNGWSITITARPLEDPDIAGFDLKISSHRQLPVDADWNGVFVAYGDEDDVIDRVQVVNGEATFGVPTMTIQTQSVHLWFEVHVPSTRRPGLKTR